MEAGLFHYPAADIHLFRLCSVTEAQDISDLHPETQKSCHIIARGCERIEQLKYRRREDNNIDEIKHPERLIYMGRSWDSEIVSWIVKAFTFRL